MRWDTPTEKFDMDATGKGLDRVDDDFYRKWPFPLTEQEIKDEDYLKSLSTREELSVFLSVRAACLSENGRFDEAADTFNAAYLRAPNWKGNQILLAEARAGRQQPTQLIFQQHAANPAAQGQGVNPNIPVDPNPLQQAQNPNRFP